MSPAPAARSLLLVLGVLAGGCATSPPQLTPQPPLPERIHLKSRQESFGRSHEVAIRNGRLWLRARRSASARWELLPPDGLPRERGWFGFEPPQRVVAVSADGDNLLAVDDEGRAFYAKLSSLDKHGLDWTDAFGLLWGEEVVLPRRHRGFAISHRGADAGWYEDIDGNRHPVSFGVSTLYALDASGQVIRYTDPWLKPTWTHVFLTPLRGRFVAINLSASASTLFVVDASGELWTRLADYDTSGENPLPGWYSYVRERRGVQKSKVRTIPGWGWVRQPPPPGPVTAEITILQTGKGNAARELRVRGRDAAGAAGYWAKPIEAKAWTFQPAPELKVAAAELLRPLPAGPRLGPRLDHDYAGTIGVTHRYAARVLAFHPHDAPARVVVDVGEHRFEALLHTRRMRKRRDGSIATALGTLELTPETLAHEDRWVRKLVQDVSGGKRLRKVEVRVSADGGELQLTEDTWLFAGRTVTLRRLRR